MLNWVRGFVVAWKGRRIGSEVARTLGMQPKLFHAAMELGGCESHLITLYEAGQTGFSIDVLAYDSIKYLSPGLDQLERQFGRQPSIASARLSLLNYLHAH